MPQPKNWKYQLNSIIKVSEKRKIANKIYSLIRVPFLLEHSKCEANLEGCTHRATEIHHKFQKENLWLICSKYFLAVCRNCHTRIGKSPNMAFEKGLCISQHSKDCELTFNVLEIELMEQHKVRY